MEDIDLEIACEYYKVGRNKVCSRKWKKESVQRHTSGSQTHGQSVTLVDEVQQPHKRQATESQRQQCAVVAMEVKLVDRLDGCLESESNIRVVM